MTYSGSMTDVSILAHELGQGFHHCVMRDLPDAQRHYGRSVAETASIFGETVVRLRNIRLSGEFCRDTHSTQESQSSIRSKYTSAGRLRRW